MRDAEKQNTDATRRGYRRWSAAVFLIVHASVVLAAAPTKFAGQSISEVLNRLRPQGLTFIYNSEVIPRQLAVRNEPQARRGLDLAREVLGPHGLTVAEVVPGVYTVIEAVNQRPVVPSAADVLTPERAAPPIEEIVVNTSRYTFTNARISYSFLTQDELQSVPRLADEPLRAVTRLPGVTNNGFSALGQIRGGETNETSIVLDGLRLAEPFHLKNFLSPVSLLDSRLVNTIEVYAGGFPAVYGGSLSGVIEATSVSPDRPRYYEAGLSLFHASALAALELDGGRGRALASVRRSNAGLLSKASERDFGTPNYSDAFTKLQYEFDSDTRGSLQALFSNDRISVLRDASTQQAKVEYRNAYSWATLERDWSQSASSRAIASFTEVTNQRRGTIDNPGRRRGSVADAREFHIVGLQLDNKWRHSNIDHRFGVSLQHLSGHYDYTNTNHFETGFPFPASPALQAVRSSAVDPSGFEISGYWSVRAEVVRGLTLEAGVRVDEQTYDDTGGGQWSPRLSMLYDLTDNTRLRASWGRYAQAQGINELQVEDGIDRFHRPQRAEHLIASFEHAFPGGVQLRIEGYRKNYLRLSPRFENLFDTLVLLPELEPDRVRLDPNSARSEGIEVLLKVAPIGGWSGWLSYARSRVADHIEGRNVRRSWDQRDAVSAGLSWSSGPWSVSSNFTYHTGWPTTGLELVGPTTGTQQLMIGERNGQRLGNFSSLDLRVTRTFALSRGVLDVFVEASNALMQHNPCCVEFDVRRDMDGDLNITRNIDDWLPLVPAAGVLWRF
jgi:outer membrane receptor protein involved in Fe transport